MHFFARLTSALKSLRTKPRTSPGRERSRPAPVEALEVRNLLAGVAPDNLLIYYAYPSGINGTFSVSGAAAEFANYSTVVLGGGLEQAGHQDHANTVAIMNHPSTAGTKFFGYVDLGVSTLGYTMPEIQQRVDAWKAAGADGIFFDDFGYDFQVTRARQNEAVDYVHSVNLPVVANGFFVDQVFGTQVDANYNPTGTATHLQATDYYLYESYQVRLGNVVDETEWRTKADALATVRETLPINVLAVTTTTPSVAFSQTAFDYAYWSAAVDGVAAFGWGEPSFSSSTASAPYRARPSTNPGSTFSAALDGGNGLFTRDTNLGRIAVDTVNDQAGFNQLDFGDAPDTGVGTGAANYATLNADNGPRHLVGGPRLGAHVDFEADAVVTVNQVFPIPSLYSLGDNIYGNDEDGVVFTSLINPSATVATAATVKVNVQNVTGSARVDGWLDFNGDGDFSDPGEQIVQNVAVAQGDNHLNFTVPAGAVHGKTYARFRVSTAGNLAPTGLANDGEVEDLAVTLGRESTLTLVEDEILSHRFSNGVLRSQNGPGLYEVNNNNKPWFVLDPYFSSFAVRALLAAPNLSTADKFDVAEDHLTFWLGQVRPDGTIPRVFVDENFQFATGPLQYYDTSTGTVKTIDPATYGADADDSSFSLILSTAAEYAANGGSVTFLNQIRPQLEAIATSLVSLIEADGLPRGFLNPATYPFKQTQDCVEVLQALRQFSTLQRDVYLDSQQAAFYANQANIVAAGIEEHLYVEELQLYRQHHLAAPPNLNLWYPDILDQYWPMLGRTIAADSARARHLLDTIYAGWDGSPNLDWTTRTDSASLAWVALQAGDTALAATAAQHALPWALRSSQPYPGDAMTIADLGFLLQTLLPSLAGSSATTYSENSAATPINPNLIVSSIGTSTLASATVTLTNFVAGQDVLSFANDGGTMGNIALSSNVNGVVTLTSAGATATLPQWQAALRAVKYSNTSDVPNVNPRTVTFQVNDGLALSNTISNTVTVQAVNDAPIIGGAVANQNVPDNFTIGPFGAMTVTDPETQAMTAVVRINNGVVRGDFTAASAIGWSRTIIGNNIQYSRTFPATANIGTTVQTALRDLTFRPRSNAIKPNTTETTGFIVTLSDGVAAPVSNNTVSVIVTSANDAPLINGASTAVTVNDNAAVNPFPNLTVTDADMQEMLVSVTILNGVNRGDFTNATSSGWTVRYVTGNNITYKRYFSPGPNVGATAQAAFRALTFQPRANAIKPGTTELVDFQVTVSDGVAPAIANNGTRVTVTSVNDAPVIGGTASGQTMNDNQTRAVFNTLTVTDPDTQEMLAKVTINNGVVRGDFTASSTAGWTRTVTGNNIIYSRYYGVQAHIATTVQAAIRAMIFQPRTNVPIGTTETTTFTVFVNDGIANVTNTATSVLTTGVAPRPVTVVPRVILDSDTVTMVVRKTDNRPPARLIKKPR